MNGIFSLTIPETISDRELVQFFKGWRWHTDISTSLSIDFEKCDFIAPYALTMFAAYILWIKKKKRRTARIRYKKDSVVGDYLEQSGFLEILGRPVSENQKASDRTVKLTAITTSAEIPVFANKVMDILKIDDEELEGAVQYSLIEILRNVVQHSSSQIGGVAMAQYYPATGLVNLCVADFGVGLKNTLSEAYPELDTNLHALKLATLPHVSRTFTPSQYTQMHDNAGLGLFFIKQIASLSGGRFFLGSYDALMNLWGNELGEQKKLYQQAKNEGWPGTFVYLQLQRESIAEFDSILTKCRKMAAEARKYPSELALDFIEEVPDIEGLHVISVKEFEENVEQAAHIRDNIIIPSIEKSQLIVIDFKKVRFATQSFIHALMYKIIKHGQKIGSTLSIANCTNSTREAILAVAAYAKATPEDQQKEIF